MEEVSFKETCPFCDQLLDKNLIKDHIMCHQIQNEEEFNNQITKNPFGNVIHNSSQNGNLDSHSNNISNYNNIDNQSKNNNTQIDQKNLNLLKALIEINKPNNDGNIQFNNLLNILNGKSNENNKTVEEDAIHTIFDGISLISQQCKDTYDQYNNIMGRGNNNNKIGSSDATNDNHSSTNNATFNDNNNILNIPHNNNHINENEVNLIMECLSTNTLNEKKVGENTKCFMCCEQFDIGQSVTTLPCFHIFHFDCIKNRIKNNNNCPICQFEISLNNIIK